MSGEVLLAAGYGVALLAGALIVEWLSIHTHNRSQQFRTSGFEYDEMHDFWVCHQGEQLWPKEFDRERRLVRYRAKSATCRACEAYRSCTDDPEGREITKAIDPWPHSEAGRFHRGIAVMMVGLAVFILVVELIRHHMPAEIAVLVPVLGLALGLGYWLGRDLLQTPTGFPEAMPAHGNRLKGSTGNAAGGADIRKWIADPDATGSVAKDSPGDDSGYLHSGNSPEPDSAVEGPSGLPPSRRRQWWESEPEVDPAALRSRSGAEPADGKAASRPR
jgi:hypothetical protein